MMIQHVHILLVQARYHVDHFGYHGGLVRVFPIHTRHVLCGVPRVVVHEHIRWEVIFVADDSDVVVE